MKKLILGLFLILFFCITNFAKAEQLGLKGYSGTYIPSASFIPVMSCKEISTEFSDSGTEVKFIGTNDFFLNDTVVLSRGTEFYGYVEKVNMPVVGTNGSMVIKIDKVKFLDGYEQAISGYIYSQNQGNVIGGELSLPAVYELMPMYYQGYDPGYLKFVPGAQRRMGTHAVVKAGEDKMIILTKPFFITHTLIN